MLNEDQDGRRTEKVPQPIRDALHKQGGVRRSLELGGDLDQDGGAAALFTGGLVQADGLDCRAELRGHEGDPRNGIIVESVARRGVYEGECANPLTADEQ